MIRNVKVDLIYYTVGSDFEMEFNLCGCCRMRLLTDTVSNRTDFSKSLARGVSRSNIIIACGPVFGETGLVSTIAKVTNIGTEVIENSKYGIDDDREISVIKGSTPLVSSDGVFGGCIIENGPQVIIVLSEGKSLRKKVMKELIHPYIAQWSFIAAQNGEFSPIVKNAQPIYNDNDINFQKPEMEINDEKGRPVLVNDNNGFLLDYDEEDTNKKRPVMTVDEENELYYNVTSFNDKSAERQNTRYYYENDEDMEFEGKKSNKTFLVVLIVLMAFFAVLLLFFAVIRPMYYGYEVLDFLKQIFTPKSIISIAVKFRGIGG
ncbi:MAG: hypothetical protein MJ090_03380 [Clostridia bacterium]|nr:hypothetical protein [Clostridia bacterium]